LNNLNKSITQIEKKVLIYFNIYVINDFNFIMPPKENFSFYKALTTL